MKKKGLIVATIVMVLVLAASLTTATFAWFSSSAVTSITGFDLTVSAGNAVNIGMSMNNTHINPANVTIDNFVYGSVEYTAGTAGTLGGGTWGGASSVIGLGATITHDIIWGTQSASVGGISTDTRSTVLSDYGTISAKANADTTGYTCYVNSANLNGAALNNVDAALPNKGASKYSSGTNAGDYAYIFLGAAPTKALANNELIILVDGTTSTGNIVGMLSAMHVAYRITKSDGAVATTWTEAELFGADNHYDTTLANVTPTLTTEEKATYNITYSATAPATKAFATKITGLSTTQGAIDQIELVIYIDGTDPDCRDAAKNASGSIKIFFHTTDAA